MCRLILMLSILNTIKSWYYGNYLYKKCIFDWRICLKVNITFLKFHSVEWNFKKVMFTFMVYPMLQNGILIKFHSVVGYIKSMSNVENFAWFSQPNGDKHFPKLAKNQQKYIGDDVNGIILVTIVSIERGCHTSQIFGRLVPSKHDEAERNKPRGGFFFSFLQYALLANKHPQPRKNIPFLKYELINVHECNFFYLGNTKEN